MPHRMVKINRWINTEIDKNLEKGLDYRKITVEGLWEY